MSRLSINFTVKKTPSKSLARGRYSVRSLPKVPIFLEEVLCSCCSAKCQSRVLCEAEDKKPKVLSYLAWVNSHSNNNCEPKIKSYLTCIPTLGYWILYFGHCTVYTVQCTVCKI